MYSTLLASVYTFSYCIFTGVYEKIKKEHTSNKKTSEKILADYTGGYFSCKQKASDFKANQPTGRYVSLWDFCRINE